MNTNILTKNCIVDVNLFLSLLFFIPSVSFAQAQDDFLSLSLEELMNMKVDISSNEKTSVREQPSTVTLLTKDFINQSGARYLQDLLKQVPGFWVGTDTIGTFSVTFRGVWGMEAKILLIIDGIEQNELAFGSLVLGNRYPVDNISRVEIIRGSGSVKYGGQAALAVIRVTSLTSNQIGQSLNFTGDFSSVNENSTTLSYSTGGEVSINNTLVHYGLSASIGQGDYSNKNWQALDGYQLSLKDNSNSEPFSFSLHLDYHDWKLQLQHDSFTQQDRLLFGDSGLFFSPHTRYTTANKLSFLHQAINLEKKWQISEKLNLDTKLTYVKQEPWNSRGQYQHNLSRYLDRIRMDMSGIYSLSELSNILTGISYYYETAKVTESYIFDPVNRYHGKNKSTNNDHAIYAQYETSFDWAKLTLGLRYENHDFAGSKLVPRVSVIKTWNKLHAKLVYNEAFKIPQFDTLASASNANTPISASETTKSWELEIGYQVNNQLAFTSNFYLQKINHYIGFNPQTASNTTLGDFSSMGIELQLNWQLDKLSFNTSYSFFAIEQNNIRAFNIESDSGAVLGIPNHMIKADLHYKLSADSSFHLVGHYTSGRYSCVDDANWVCGTPEKLDNSFDFKLFYQYKLNKSYINFGVSNILNEDNYLVQPYRGSQSPIQSYGRRLMLDLHYQF